MKLLLSLVSALVLSATLAAQATMTAPPGPWSVGDLHTITAHTPDNDNGYTTFHVYVWFWWSEYPLHWQKTVPTDENGDAQITDIVNPDVTFIHYGFNADPNIFEISRTIM